MKKRERKKGRKEEEKVNGNRCVTKRLCETFIQTQQYNKRYTLYFSSKLQKFVVVLFSLTMNIFIY
jgi:hypothetical protein